MYEIFHVYIANLQLKDFPVQESHTNHSPKFGQNEKAAAASCPLIHRRWKGEVTVSLAVAEDNWQ